MNINKIKGHLTSNVDNNPSPTPPVGLGKSALKKFEKEQARNRLASEANNFIIQDVAKGASHFYDDTNLHTSNHYKYGITKNRITDSEVLDKQRAENQSAFEQLGRMGVQAVGNEIIIGTLRGFSDIFDLAYNKIAQVENNDYTNSFTDLLEDWRDTISRSNEIYLKDPEESFAFGDFGWWTNNAISAASTLSMLIPTATTAKGISIAGKSLRSISAINKAAKVLSPSARLGKLSKTLGITKYSNTATRGFNELAEVVGHGFISRATESYAEAREARQTVLNSTKDYLSNLDEKQRKELYKRNPEFIGKTDDEISEIIAGKSADQTFEDDMKLVALDILQWAATKNIFKGRANIATNSKIRLAQEKALKKLAGDKTEEISSFINKSLMKEKLAGIYKEPIKFIGALGLDEGLEEFYQGVAQEEAKELSAKILDKNYVDRNTFDYLTDDKLLEQAFWGIAGGMLFQAGASAFGKAKNEIEFQRKKGGMTEDEIINYKLGEDKLRLNEIDIRQRLTDEFIKQMNLLNKGLDYNKPVKGEDGKQELDEEGNPKYETLDYHSAEFRKKEILKQYATELALNSASVGNYNLLKDFITDERFAKYLSSAGVELKEEFQKDLIDKMDTSVDTYTKHYSNLFGEIEDPNHTITDKIAKDLTRAEDNIDSYTSVISDLTSELNNLPKNDDLDVSYDDLIKHHSLGFIIQERKNIEKQYKEKLEKFNKGEYLETGRKKFEEEYERLRKENDKAIEELIPEVFTEDKKKVIRDSLRNSFDKGGVEEYLKNLENYAKEIGLDKESILKKYASLGSNKPFEELTESEKTAYMIGYYKYERSKAKSTIPKSAREYKELYKSNDYSARLLAKLRLDNASKIVQDYIEKSDNPVSAFNDLLNNDIEHNKEIKDALIELGFGYGESLEDMYSGLHRFVEQVLKDRKEKEKDKERVSSNTNSTDEGKAGHIEAVNNAEKIGEGQHTPSTGLPTQVDQSLGDTEVISDEEFEEQTKEAEKLNEKYRKDKNDSDDNFVPDFSEIEERVNRAISTAILETVVEVSKNGIQPLDYIKLVADSNTKEFKLLQDKILSILINKNEKGINKYLEEITDDDLKRKILNTLKASYNRAKTVEGASEENVRKAEEIISIIDSSILGFNTEDGNLSVVSLLDPENTNKRIEIIDSFIDSLIEEGVVSPRGLSIHNIINQLLNNKNISKNLAKTIYNNIYWYMLQPDTKYKIIGKNEAKSLRGNVTQFLMELEKYKSQFVLLDGGMHVSPTNNESGKNALENLNRGDELEATLSKSGNSISITKTINGEKVEVGYLGAVVGNGKGNGFRLKTTRGKFNPFVTNDNGNYKSTLDDLYNISREIYLTGLANKDKDINEITSPIDFYIKLIQDINYRNIPNRKDIKEKIVPALKHILSKDINRLTLSSIIKNAVKDGTIKLNKKQSQRTAPLLDLIERIDSDKDYNDIISSDEVYLQIMEDILDIMDYSHKLLRFTALSKADENMYSEEELDRTYENWKKSQFDNFINTYKIQEKIKNKDDSFSIVVSGIVNQEVLYDNDNPEANTFGEISKYYDTSETALENNPVVVFSGPRGGQAEAISEGSRDPIVNRVGFEPGTMAIVVANNKYSQAFSVITGGRSLFSIKENEGELFKQFNQAVTRELETLFSDYLTGKQTPKQIYHKLSNLLGGTSAYRNGRIIKSPILKGYTVFFDESGNISLMRDGTKVKVDGVEKNKYDVVLGIDKKTNKPYMFIDIDGNKIKITTDESGKVTRNVQTASLTLLKNIRFNTTFFGVETRNIPDTSRDIEDGNNYMYRKNGKFVLTVGGKDFTFDSFTHFIFQMNPYNTNQIVENDSLMTRREGSRGDFYIELKSKDNKKVVKQKDAITKLEEAKDGDVIKVSSLINSFKNITEEDSEEINTNRIPLFPKTITVRKTNGVGLARYVISKDTVEITQSGINNLAKLGSNAEYELTRLLLHEQFHANLRKRSRGINSKSEAQRDKQIVNDLKETYNIFKDVVSIIENYVDKFISGEIQENEILNLVHNELFDKGYVSDKESTQRLIEDVKNLVYIHSVKNNTRTIYRDKKGNIHKQDLWKLLKNAKDDDKGLEEWLVESITQKVIVSIAGNINYTKDIKQRENNKSLFDRIIDKILEWFGLTENIKENSIFAKQREILYSLSKIDKKQKKKDKVKRNKTKINEDNKNQPVEGEEPQSKPTELEVEEKDEETIIIEDVEELPTEVITGESKQEDDVTGGLLDFDSLLNNDSENKKEETSEEYDEFGDIFLSKHSIKEDIEFTSGGITNPVIVDNIDNYISSFKLEDREKIKASMAKNSIQVSCKV